MVNCAITGANGYIGSRLSDFFIQRGFTVFACTRRLEPGSTRGIYFELRTPPSAEEFRSRHIEILIHCAYDFSVTRWGDIERLNIEGTRKLMDAAKAGGVQRIVTISSQSAFTGCKSLYGKAKLAIEHLTLELGGVVVRPGLVYGNTSGGMMGSLQKSVTQNSLLPVIQHPGETLRLIHEDDLCNLVYQLATDAVVTASKPVIAASIKGYSLGRIVRSLARATGKTVSLIPVPWQVAWLGLKTLEILGLKPGFKSDSILALGHPNDNPEADAVRLPQFPIREFQEVV